jgi:two-component system, NarL family, response regulator LiaR
MCKITALTVGDLPAAWRDFLEARQPAKSVRLVGETTSEAQAVELTRQLRPDVILLNVNMGTPLVRRLCQENSTSAVMTLMAGIDGAEARKAFRAGSSGCCRPDLSLHQLEQALCQVALGHYVLDDQVFDKEGMQARLVRSSATDHETSPSFTPREMDILQYLTQGLSNKEIAQALGISQPTVRNHITSMLGKLQAVDRTQMAVYALRRGLVHLQKT